jgi:HlyD family secretion protein
VDSIGTTSQGVVNYNVTIALDTQDARVLPGMSVTTNIITQAVQDALLVPSAAVKTQNGTSFVQTIDNPTADELANIAGFVAPTAPRQIEVQVGASNDTTAQILSGVQEGDPIITRTITSTAAAAATATSRTSAGSILGGGGAVRAIGR